MITDIYTQAFYLAIGLFLLGLVIAVTKRNVIFILMGIELMLNGAHLNLVVNAHKFGQIDGQIMVVFTIVLAAAEVAIALALLLRLYRYIQSSDLNKMDSTGH